MFPNGGGGGCGVATAVTKKLQPCTDHLSQGFAKSALWHQEFLIHKCDKQLKRQESTYHMNGNHTCVRGLSGAWILV